MEFSATASNLDDLRPWRDMYRLEMPCQIIHDSIHERPGWTQEYFLAIDGVNVGYGSLAIAGPWKDKPTVYEFYIAPPHRGNVFELFGALLDASGAVGIETQSDDPSLTIMLHAFARDVASESILFHDRITTALPPQGSIFRAATPADEGQLAGQELDTSADWLVELDGVIAGAGGILFHYNRPYGDIYMKIAAAYRQRGLGSFLVQEMKRVCYERGNVPAARCGTTNLASRRTLQRAGFVPCGHILAGLVAR